MFSGPILIIKYLDYSHNDIGLGKIMLFLAVNISRLNQICR